MKENCIVYTIKTNCKKVKLASLVTFSDGSSITYYYDAEGNKLRVIYSITGESSLQRNYSNGVIYDNGRQQCVFTEEGYINLTDNKYYYYLKDHQGNNRVVVDENENIVEVNHYYPFGGVFSDGDNVQPYKYNGKEYDSKAGLNWYDYGARHYDPAISRFTTMDPLAEKYYSTSPYAYCLNNPVKYVDPNGCFASTHTDSLGNVVAVFDDGDLGIYRHDTDVNGVKEQLAENYSFTNTSAGGEKMGDTEYWDEFGNSQGIITNSRIYYNSSWDNDINILNKEANGMGLYKVAIESFPNKRFDIKTNKMYAPSGVGTGKLLRGKYASARSAGNFLAGMNGATGTFFGKYISLETYMRMAGALHWATNKFSTSIKPPYYGEIPYAGRMIVAGFNYGRNK